MPPSYKKTNTLQKPYDNDTDNEDENLIYDKETLPSILPPKIKKIKVPRTVPLPKPTKKSKSALRKIAKLEEEKIKKLKRGELYASLAATAIPEEHLRLLQKSGSAIGITNLTHKQQAQREADFKSAGLSFAPSGKSISSDEYIDITIQSKDDKEEEEETQSDRRRRRNDSDDDDNDDDDDDDDNDDNDDDDDDEVDEVDMEEEENVKGPEEDLLDGLIDTQQHGAKKRKRVTTRDDTNDVSMLTRMSGKEEVDNTLKRSIDPTGKKIKKRVRWSLPEEEEEGKKNLVRQNVGTLKKDEVKSKKKNDNFGEDEEEDYDEDNNEDDDDDEEEEEEDEDDDDDDEEDNDNDDNDNEEDEDSAFVFRPPPLIIPPSKFSFSINLPTKKMTSKPTVVNSEEDLLKSEKITKAINTTESMFISPTTIFSSSSSSSQGDEVSRSVAASAASKRAALPDQSEIRLAELRARNEALNAKGLTAASLLPKLRGGVSDDYSSGDKQRRVHRNNKESLIGTINEKEEDVDDNNEDEENTHQSLAEITAQAVAAANAENENDDDGPHVASATKNWWDPSSYISASSTSEQQALSAAITAGVAGKGAFGLLTQEEVSDRVSADMDDLRSQLWMADGSKVIGIHHKQALASWSAYGRTSIRLKRDHRVQEARMELPVCRMEQEIMEALSSSDVLILCGETGSGKTTQIPQFLLEAGYGSLDTEIKLADELLSTSTTTTTTTILPPPPFYLGFPGLIGVTQPRRVAATSTADRVRSELSVDTILARSIAHQVRHDSRSVSSTTKLKFMTDGILMREVQSDLLLRKYSVIVIDEAHERNVNTDVLIGILSRVIPLRNKIAKEEADKLRSKRIAALSKDPTREFTIPLPGQEGCPIGPLKLIIMSATLRVDDFAANIKLFPSRPPVIKVEARQHTVTIHFAKQTSTDGDYVNEALKKACKVHSRLPEGGLLIFLSGSDEVEYLCGELRKRYGTKKAAAISAENEVKEAAQAAYDAAMIAAKAAGSDEETAKALAETAKSENEELIKKRQRKASGGSSAGLGPAFILPLYALLPAAQQSRVFEPPPEGSRLIVVATNVAETSITIPGIR